MAESLEIKHGEPTPRQMVAEYRIMFSGTYLKFLLIWCVLIAALVGVWFVTPSSTEPNANIVLRLIALFDACFLFGFAGLFVFWLASPFIARFILPLVVALLEILRLLIFFVQYMIDGALIEPLTKSDLYPTAEDKTAPDA